MVLLDENAIKSMAPGRFFRDHKGAVNSLDFHHTEDVMVTVGTFDRPAKNPGVLLHEGTARRVDLCSARDRAASMYCVGICIPKDAAWPSRIGRLDPLARSASQDSHASQPERIA